jgi:hypothetical protein
MMIVKASGGVVVRERADGRSTYAIRRRRGGRQESVVLGGLEDGWTEEGAAPVALLFAALPGRATPATAEALRRLKSGPPPGTPDLRWCRA